MKPEDMFERIGEADERYVADARKKKRPRTWIPVGAVAAMLAVVILVGAFLQPWNPTPLPGGETTGGAFLENETTGGDPLGTNPPERVDLLEAFALASAEYPLMVQFPSDPYDGDQYDEWSASRRAQTEAYRALAEDQLPTEFLYAAMQAFLADANGENRICSPVNIYMALAMLAETANGETRREILDALGEESIESLRTTANAVWNAHYCDDGAYTSVLGASLWLDEGLSYTEETVKTLAEIYFASIFQGEMGSEEYNEALRTWLNTQTGGLLSDRINGLELSPETVFAIATTVYFRARWEMVFDARKNTEALFRGADGDTLCTFMNAQTYGNYYWGERFSSIDLNFEEGGSVYFLLPDEGVSAESLLSDPEVLSLLSQGWGYENKKYCEITLSIPKFDVSSQLDLREGMQELGITSVFDPSAADFSSISSLPGLALSRATHGARVAIDEEGCVAAAFTLFEVGAAASPTDRVTFTVDRPFLFVVTSEVGAPLFVGVVNNCVNS